MSSKDFNEMPLEDRINLLENIEGKAIEPIVQYEKYKADLYLVNDMIVNVLVNTEDDRIVRATAIENEEETEMFSDCIYMN